MKKEMYSKTNGFPCGNKYSLVPEIRSGRMGKDMNPMKTVSGKQPSDKKSTVIRDSSIDNSHNQTGRS